MRADIAAYPKLQGNKAAAYGYPDQQGVTRWLKTIKPDSDDL